MRKLFFLSIAVTASLHSFGQDYNKEVFSWQQEYKKEFLTDARSPVKAKDTGYIRFFQPDARWKVQADAVLTPDARPFDMATHSGKTKRFRSYVSFRFADPLSKERHYLTLTAYERVDPPIGDTMSAHLLFLPFQDLTNGEETYGGGRYMDMKKETIAAGKVSLDFNEAYNPYCAFGSGYSCPIPPSENRLKTRITAGEMMPAEPLRAKE